MCVCLVWVKKRKEGRICGERGVVTETGGTCRRHQAQDHQTYTQAVHGVTNLSVLVCVYVCVWQLIFISSVNTLST